MAGNLQEFTDGNFQDEVLQSNQPVLVDFWAPWCGPCRQLTPTIEALASEYAGKLKVGKLNTDENPQVPGHYQISAIPTVILFQNGEVVQQIRGAYPKKHFDEILKTVV